MKVDHQNYQQELQLLRFHFFSYLLIAEVYIELFFSCLISNLCVLAAFPAIDAVQSLCIDERNVLSSLLDILLHTSLGQQAMVSSNVRLC